MNKFEDKLVSLSRKMEVPSNLVRNVSKIEIISNDTVTIENHKGILHYEDTEIHVNCGDIIVRVFGFNLELLSMSSDILSIYGNIQNIDFLR